MKTTYFPCVRGTMGDWTYYTTVMAVKDLVQYVRFAEQLSPNKDPLRVNVAETVSLAIITEQGEMGTQHDKVSGRSF